MEGDPSHGPTRVFVLDGHRVFAEALVDALELEPGISVVGLATDLPTARARLGGNAVDVLIVDPATVGCATLKEIRDCAGPTTIAVLSDSSTDVGNVVAEGVRGWFWKNEMLSSLVEALPRLRAGWAYFPPRRLGEELDALSARIRELEQSVHLFAALTPRERQVLGALMEGKERTTIAADLFLSEGTVRAHVEHVKAKLGAPSTIAAVATARRLGWGRLLGPVPGRN